MATTTPGRRLYTAAEVARILGVTLQSVRQLVTDGQLRSIRFGPYGWHRIPVEEVERLIAGER